ncbi:MAG: elongation factor P [Candidatus Electryonea clarkiae]|nr:elongation factor P [Candidatus Electryonea clarkiae]MDP8288891.1 elongation factor P [Candidatus Electryonea clarkiae]
MATTADFRNGLVVRFKNELYAIVEFQHVKPGKGGAFVRTKFKNVVSGRVLENTFRAGEKVEVIKLAARSMQYLYQEGEQYVFMEEETYEQYNLNSSLLEGNVGNYLKEGESYKVLFEESEPLIVEVPNFLELKITVTEPGVKGDTVSSTTKPATLETGAVVQVPLFVSVGETIKVDTRTNEYLERVSK